MLVPPGMANTEDATDSPRSITVSSMYFKINLDNLISTCSSFQREYFYVKIITICILCKFEKKTRWKHISDRRPMVRSANGGRSRLLLPQNDERDFMDQAGRRQNSARGSVFFLILKKVLIPTHFSDRRRCLLLFLFEKLQRASSTPSSSTIWKRFTSPGDILNPS